MNQATKNTVKELLNDNPKALQFLHRQCGFDFCKPFNVVKLYGSYTLNSVKMAINADTLKGLNIFILSKIFDYYGNPDKEMYAVNVNSSRVIGAQRGELVDGWYSFNIDYFGSIGCYEKIRKNRTRYIYIVCQRAEYGCTPKAEISETYNADMSKRYRTIEVNRFYHSMYAKECYIGSLILKDTESNTRPFKLRLSYSNINPYTKEDQIIDKSGYLTHSRKCDLKERAKELRKQKAKAEYLRQDYTADNNEVRKTLAKVTREAGEQLIITTKSGNYNRLSECVKVLADASRYLERHEEKTIKKEFASVGDFLGSLQEIKNGIEKAKKFLTPITPQNFMEIATQELPPEHIIIDKDGIYIKFSLKASELVNRLTENIAKLDYTKFETYYKIVL